LLMSKLLPLVLAFGVLLSSGAVWQGRDQRNVLAAPIARVFAEAKARQTFSTAQSTTYPGCTIEANVVAPNSVCGENVGTPVLYQGVVCADNFNIRWDKVPCASRANLSTDFDVYIYTYFGYCGWYPTAAGPGAPITVTAPGLIFSVNCPYPATPTTISTTCLTDVGTVAWDTFSIVWQLIGIRLPSGVANAAGKVIGQDLTKSLKPSDVSNFKQLSNNMTAASSLPDKALAIFNIARKIASIVQPEQIAEALYAQLSFLQKAEYGAEAVAQIIALIATDGLAELADLALLTLDIAKLVQASIALSNNC